MKYLDYAQVVNANEETKFWIEHNLVNYLAKNTENQDEIEHIIDYFSATNPPRLNGMSYPEAKVNAEKWLVAQKKKGANIEEKPEDTKVVLDFKDGFKIVQLIGENAYKREGFLMSHCVGSYFGRGKTILSLRDAKNNPHCTIEIN